MCIFLNKFLQNLTAKNGYGAQKCVHLNFFLRFFQNEMYTLLLNPLSHGVSWSNHIMGLTASEYPIKPNILQF